MSINAPFSFSLFEEISKKTLSQINILLKDTPFVKKLNINSDINSESISSLKFTTYDDYFEFVNLELQATSKNNKFLVNDEICSFLSSGGTSGKPKIIILTQQTLRYWFKLSSYIREKQRSIVGSTNWKKISLVFSDPDSVKKSQNGTRIGIGSTFMLEKYPQTLASEVGGCEIHYATSLGQFLEQAVVAALKEPMLQEISSVFPFGIIKFCILAEEISGKSCKEIWPNMKLISTACQGSFSLFKNKILNFFPSATIYDSQMSSSECPLYAINVSTEESGKDLFVMNPYLGFYEFQDKNGQVHHNTLNLKIGQVYELISTNMNGFLRYSTKDLWCLHSLIEGCPIFKYVGRKGILSVANERVDESDIQQAALESIGSESDVYAFTCCVSVEMNAKYKLLYFCENHEKFNPIEIAKTFDLTLQRSSPNEYGWARTQGYLNEPLVIIKCRKSFELAMLEKQQLNLQGKLPVVMAEEIFKQLLYY